MHVRAGKLAWGALNSNECPAGSARITDEAQCTAAAATAGLPWGGSAVGSLPDAAVPRGCFWYGEGPVYLNTHPWGSSFPSAQLLCAVAATGVRARVVCVCARARVCACFEVEDLGRVRVRLYVCVRARG